MVLFHLNLAQNGDEFSKTLGVDRCSMNFTKLDEARVEVSMDFAKLNFDIIWASDGLQKFCLLIILVLLLEDAKVGLDTILSQVMGLSRQ